MQGTRCMGIFITLLTLISSCRLINNDKRLTLVESDIIVSQSGTQQTTYHPKSGKKVVTFYITGNFINELKYTPMGKIDRIIQSYPKWDFVFYVEGTLEDTTIIRKALSKYNCRFPVVLDYNHSFRDKNSLGKLTSIGYICNEKNQVLSLALIGTDRSFFDQEFRKYNR